MKPRKIVLLSALALLEVLLVVQLLTPARGALRELRLSESPNTIVITQNSGSVTLALKSGAWVVGDAQYPADTVSAQRIAASIGDIKVLDIVAKTGNDAVLARYGLDAANAITVKALKGGTELRTLIVGKDAPTASQTYISLQGGRDIYLALGTLRSTFGMSIDELRSKVVYSVKYDDITKIAVSGPSGTWSLEKAGTPSAWSLAPEHRGSAGEPTRTAAATSTPPSLDPDKAVAWIKSLAELNAESWLADDASLPNVAPTTVTLGLGDHEVSVSIYPSGSGKDMKYVCSSSSTPYKFMMGSYEAAIFLKPLADLKK
jgi:hypothetical protein